MPRIRDAARSTSWPHPLTITGIYRLVPLPYISDFEEWVLDFREFVCDICWSECECPRVECGGDCCYQSEPGPR